VVWSDNGLQVRRGTRPTHQTVVLATILVTCPTTVVVIVVVVVVVVAVIIIVVVVIDIFVVPVLLVVVVDAVELEGLPADGVQPVGHLVDNASGSGSADPLANVRRRRRLFVAAEIGETVQQVLFFGVAELVIVGELAVLALQRDDRMTVAAGRFRLRSTGFVVNSSALRRFISVSEWRGKGYSTKMTSVSW